MPDRNAPKWGRISLRVIGALSYALVALAGVTGATWPPENAPVGDHGLIVGIGIALTVASCICLFAVLTFRWRVELMAVWWVGLFLAGYALVALAQRPLTPLLNLMIFLDVALCLTILSRGVSLLVFADGLHRHKEG
jgi:hypothetical protein